MSDESTRGRLFRTATRGMRHTRGTRTASRLGETRTSTRALDPVQRRRVVARRWWRRTRRRAGRAWRGVTQAVTPLGWFVLALTASGAVLGVAFSWIEAWFAAVVGGLLLVIAAPFLVGSRAYRVRLLLDRRSVTVGGEVQVRVIVENGGSRPALPAVAELPVGPALRELTVPFIGPGASVELPVRVPAARRGVVPVGPLTVARRDPSDCCGAR